MNIKTRCITLRLYTLHLLPRVIQSLTSEQQHITHAFVEFFQKKIDFETLQRQLKK